MSVLELFGKLNAGTLVYVLSHQMKDPNVQSLLYHCDDQRLTLTQVMEGNSADFKRVDEPILIGATSEFHLLKC